MSSVATLYPTIFLRQYVAGKTATDPLYEAVFERLRETREPILDAGCGIGVLAAFLRARGVRVPIVGIDRDPKKIAVAREAVQFDDVRFEVADMRDLPAWNGTVVMLDVLHYVDAATRAKALDHAAESATTVIIRNVVRDASWRFVMNHAMELFARVTGWLKSERLDFPTRDAIVSHFARFDAEVVPMWGRTPFNNYLFDFRRSSAGMTNT